MSVTEETLDKLAEAIVNPDSSFEDMVRIIQADPNWPCPHYEHAAKFLAHLLARVFEQLVEEAVTSKALQRSIEQVTPKPNEVGNDA